MSVAAAVSTLPQQDPVPGVAEQISALRARGTDPVGLRRIEALVRRADSHAGLTRRLLDQRVQQLLLATSEPEADPREDTQPDAATVPVSRHGPLTDLLAHIANHGASPGPHDQDPARPGHGRGRGNEHVQGHEHNRLELKAIRDYRATWKRLSVERRLLQALHQVPDNAGPLNTQRLLHQALAAMGDASAPYLHRFMEQVEALLWLDQLNPAPAAPKKPRHPGTKPC